MKNPAEKTSNAKDTAPQGADSATEAPLPKGYTAPKGRPTPKRRDVEIARGVIRSETPTASEERAKRKALKASMTRQEWREYKRKEREASQRRRAEVQAAMDRGEERYLLARDKGRERAYARDWVDSRRFVNNYLMPVAFVLMILLLVSTRILEYSEIASIISTTVILALAAEGVYIGISANRAVRRKFPSSTATGWGLGFYAYSRASQIRRWRSPRPRVEVGDNI